MRRSMLTLIAGTMLAAQAKEAEADVTIRLPLSEPPDQISIDYDCDGHAMTVEYYNAGPISLAVFAYEGEPVVASNVLSASGARYAGGRFIWWAKGVEGSLYDLTLGEDAEPVAVCHEKA